MIKNKTKDESILTQEDLNPRNIKWRLTMLIDLDVLDEIKKQAKQYGLGYQSLINSTSREVFMRKNKH
ncbi:MAG: hypothetical protein HQK53_12735 [Oligoflexia bacterium]|nr:hypothetical protein [Oligoflexia bacterium]